MVNYYIKAVVSNGYIEEASVIGHVVPGDNVNEAIQNYRELVLSTKGEENYYLLVQKCIFVDIIDIYKVDLSEAV
jgi:hypothetical protein